MEDMSDCTVRLCDHSETVQVDRVQRCTILIGASCESVFLRNATDCTFYVACKQLRTRDCVNCRVFLYAKTDPIIEASHGMRFGPWTVAYPLSDIHFKSAALVPQHNHWRRVFDFSTGDAALPTPHWSLMDESEYSEDLVITDLPGYAVPPHTPVNPVPRTAAPKVDGENGAAGLSGVLSFDIRATSQQAAEAALAQRTG